MHDLTFPYENHQEGYIFYVILKQNHKLGFMQVMNMFDYLWFCEETPAQKWRDLKE